MIKKQEKTICSVELGSIFNDLTTTKFKSFYLLVVQIDRMVFLFSSDLIN